MRRAKVQCALVRDSLDARLDGELTPDEAREIDQHLATCASCAKEYATLQDTHRLLSENLMRYSAPDVLKARIRSAVADAGVKDAGARDAGVRDIDARDADVIRPATRRSRPWWRSIAAGLVIAIGSSALTYTAMGRARATSETDELLASHVRSLLPGHLTDVVSTSQHQVKPWFNGRADVSPSVPNLDSLGFPLVGGRTDYVRGRVVPVVVYARRQHMINVYVWPTSGPPESGRRVDSKNGYHFIEWRSAGLEYWAVSDLNTTELETFTSLFTSGR